MKFDSEHSRAAADTDPDWCPPDTDGLISLTGGTRLPPHVACEAIEEAMLIIEKVGAVAVEYEHRNAAKWMRTYYPNRA